MYAANWFAHLPDSITALLRVWPQRACSLMIRACLRHMLGDPHYAIMAQGEERRRLEQNLLPLPALWPDDAASTTWFGAAQRLAYMPDEVADTPLIHAWMRALMLGLLVQTESAREVLFAHAPFLVVIRQSQCPPRQRLAAFLPPLYCALDRFARRDYVAPTVFLQECWALWSFRIVPPIYQRDWTEEEREAAAAAYTQEVATVARIAAHERLDVAQPDEFLQQLAAALAASRPATDEADTTTLGALQAPQRRGKKRKRGEGAIGARAAVWKASDAYH